MEIARPMFDRFSQKMTARSAALLLVIDNRLDRILQFWLIAAGALSIGRIAFSSHAIPFAPVPTIFSYFLLVVAPFASTLLALHWFRDANVQAPPATRLARWGSWTALSPGEARRHRLYGTSGIMVSLLVGMMLNVPIRALEYFAAIPPIPEVAPRWFSALHFAMTFDAVLFGSLYMIAFAAALRRAPIFPRLLLAIWFADLAMQMVTAQLVTAAGPLPSGVSDALHSLLSGNVQKTLISMALWLPYMLLSTRVNVTYRHRIPA
jgi:hypothetical protein